MPRRIGVALVSILLGGALASPACGSFSEGKGTSDAAVDSSDDVNTDGGGEGGDGGTTPTECWALSFDGTGDYVEVPDDPALDPTGPSTIEAWVRHDDDERNEYQVVSHHHHDDKTGYLLMVYGIGTRQKDGGGPPELGASGRYYDGTQNWQVGFGASSRVAKGAWTHIAVAYDGSGNLRTYVNGEPRVTLKPTTSPANMDNLGPLRIGASAQGTGGFFFLGLIDEVRISKVARYGPAQFVPRRRFLSDPDTIALYHFDEGQGDRAEDAMGKHGGQIFGAAWERTPCE